MDVTIIQKSHQHKKKVNILRVAVHCLHIVHLLAVKTNIIITEVKIV